MDDKAKDAAALPEAPVIGDRAKDAAALPVAPAMDGNNDLLPVSTTTGDTPPSRHAPFPAVLVLCLWSVVSAGLFNKSLWWYECYKLTASNDVAVRALLHVLTQGSVPQAVMAVLALLVPARDRITRRALALATLAITVTNHCILAWSAGLIFVGTSGDARGILIVAVVGAYVFLAAVFALFFFVALVLGGELVE